nr:alpha-ketoglutarate-dependent dioxygenase AlkB [Rhizobium lusitanum]
MAPLRPIRVRALNYGWSDVVDLILHFILRGLEFPYYAFKAMRMSRQNAIRDSHFDSLQRDCTACAPVFDEGTERVRKGDDIPPFLLPLREMAGSFAGIDPDRLEQALVTEYGPGAPIGWHKDKFVFGRVVGISLLSPCIFRLRRRHGDRWQRSSIIAEPGSAYVMAGDARTLWEHSIPPVDQLRYSITFRELNTGT